MQLQADIDEKQKEIKLLCKLHKHTIAKKEKLLLLQKQEKLFNILIVNGHKYTYHYAHTYDEGGDIYKIDKSSEGIEYDRKTDNIVSCQLHFEGNIIDMSGKLKWNSSSGESNINSLQQSCILKKGKFEIEFDYNGKSLTPTAITYDNYWSSDL
jgi:hypothetical protein